MSSMRRVVKKLDRYVCAADVFGIYEDETGIAFLDSSLVNNLGHYSIIGRCPYLRLVKNGDTFEVNGDSEKNITFETAISGINISDLTGFFKNGNRWY